MSALEFQADRTQEDETSTYEFEASAETMILEALGLDFTNGVLDLNDGETLDKLGYTGDRKYSADITLTRTRKDA